MRAKWLFGVAGSLAWVAACSGGSSTFGSDGNGNSSSSGGGGDDSGGGTTFSSSGSNGTFGGSNGGSNNNGSANSPCKGGFYEGSFGGLYSSSLTGFGINIPVVGDVQLTLQQMGTGMQTCMFEGETDQCSDIFSVQNGTIKGTADGLFPYYCTSGRARFLGCKQKKLVGGWIQCTYCIGSLNDGGMSCMNGGSGKGNAGGGVSRHRRPVRGAADLRLLLQQHRRRRRRRRHRRWGQRPPRLRHRLPSARSQRGRLRPGRVERRRVSCRVLGHGSLA